MCEPFVYYFVSSFYFELENTCEINGERMCIVDIITLNTFIDVNIMASLQK